MALLTCGVLLASPPSGAHPHGFVDGGVDFRVADSLTLEALQVTWLLDEFESLYMLSAAEIGLNAQGDLDAADRDAFTEQMRVWLSDFAGSAHPTRDGEPVALNAASALGVDVVAGRLKLTFERTLTNPLPLAGLALDVGFYEGTYFYAHSVTRPSRIHGADTACATRVVAHDREEQYDALQATLMRLSREDAPEDPNVGALFADRILLTCD